MVPIFLIVLWKLKIKRWWKNVNLIVFAIYISIAMYKFMTSPAFDGGFVVSLLTSFLLFFHTVLILLTYYISKRI